LLCIVLLKNGPGSRRFAAADTVHALLAREPEGANREERLAGAAG
jgi:hypothetical protein